MLLIIAHHYVVNSNVLPLVMDNPADAASKFLLVFGAWGKMGINCFVLITGYFMCKSSITLYKFLKLVCEILFYNLVIFAVFVAAGIEPFGLKALAMKFMVVRNMNGGFMSGFIMFYLFIPFLTVLVRNLSRRQHLALAGLVLLTFTVMGSIPLFTVTVNYVVQFCSLFVIASYVRLHGFPWRLSRRQWGLATLASLAAGAASVLAMQWLCVRMGNMRPDVVYYWVSDSNKILAMLPAFCGFMWFKDMNIGYSRFINLMGGATFGVLLIHANSATMRQWLWNDVVDCAGHFGDPWLWVYAPACVLAIFAVCAAIDCLRSRYVEEPLLRWCNAAALRVRRMLPV